MGSITQEPTIKEYVVQTSFGKIHTLEAGSGVPIIFLHGWNVSARSCKNIFRSLGKTHRVIAPTMPGSSPSFVWGKLPTPEEVKKVLHEWFTNLNIEEDAILVGHSLGGVYSILLTEAIDEKGIKKLILIDIVGLPLVRPMKDWTKEWVQKRLLAYKKYGISNTMRHVDSQFLKSAILRTSDTIRLGKFAKTVDVEKSASQISIPVVILWGEEDYFTPIETGKAFAQKIQNVSLHVVPGTHDWPLLDPDPIKTFV